MPYYQITITGKSGKIYQGIKFDFTDDVDLMYRKSCLTAKDKLQDEFDEIDVVMLSAHSKVLKAHLTRYRSERLARKNRID
jgi:hypothetical protein